MYQYDFGETKNMEKYGQPDPPRIPLENITKLPIAIFMGDSDLLSYLSQARWIKKLLNKSGSALAHYEEFPGGHATFLVGKDMSYWGRVMAIIEKYNPLP